MTAALSNIVLRMNDGDVDVRLVNIDNSLGVWGCGRDSNGFVIKDIKLSVGVIII